MDPDAPGTRQFAQVLDDLRRRALFKTSIEELRALDRQVEENRRLRKLMFQVRPVTRSQEDSTIEQAVGSGEKELEG